MSFWKRIRAWFTSLFKDDTVAVKPPVAPQEPLPAPTPKPTPPSPLAEATEALQPATVAPEPEGPSLAEMSESLTGDPEYYLKYPASFEKMKKWYDPERVPFDRSSWHRVSYQQKDSRAYKNVVIDGVEYRRKTPQAMGSDYYWIGKGVRDLLEEPLWHFEVGPKDPPVSLQLERIRKYQGGLRTQVQRWPEPYKSEYLASH